MIKENSLPTVVKQLGGGDYEDLTMGEKYTNQDFHPSVEGRVQGRKDSNAGNRVLIGLVSVRTGRRSDAQLLFIIAASEVSNPI